MFLERPDIPTLTDVVRDSAFSPTTTFTAESVGGIVNEHFSQCDVKAFQPNLNVKGTYEKINRVSSVEYQVAETREEIDKDLTETVFNKIPYTWFCLPAIDGTVKYFLYPPLHIVQSTIGEPFHWKNTTFARFKHPTDEWREFDITEIHFYVSFDKPGNN